MKKEKSHAGLRWLLEAAADKEARRKNVSFVGPRRRRQTALHTAHTGQQPVGRAASWRVAKPNKTANHHQQAHSQLKRTHRSNKLGNEKQKQTANNAIFIHRRRSTTSKSSNSFSILFVKVFHRFVSQNIKRQRWQYITHTSDEGNDIKNNNNNRSSISKQSVTPTNHRQFHQNSLSLILRT